MEDEVNNIINIGGSNQKRKIKLSKTTIFIILIIIVLAIVIGIMTNNSNETNSKTGNVVSDDNLDSSNSDNDNSNAGTDNSNTKKVKLETNQGDIVIELYDDMPITTGNFVKLIEEGKYDGVIFHRVIDGFMIQGGDPTGTGFGDPSIPNIQDEFTHSGGNKNNRGTISMANSGPNTGSSQFFINLADNNFLDDKHPAFGKVVEGMDVVEKIATLEKNSDDKPLEDVKIIKASLV